ncbi:MAG: PQQ-binding-like beta-propeller repeat protein, partial [Planctomycetaceae bacterium]|nr:PQQ-binding-like beta-propeller repeat protein [Planctomycetaceae bacterium]
RDAVSVRGVNLEDGRELWKYPLQVSLETALNPRNEVQDQRDEIELDRLGLSNALACGVSADSERVYVVEGPFDQLVIAPGETPGNQSSYFRITALPLDTRNPLSNPLPVVPIWRTGDSVNPELTGMTFLGPPTPAYGRLYCIAESDLLLYLLELDAATGDLLDKTTLAVLQRSLVRDPSRLHLVCIPSISRGIAVCPTLNGLLVGVDLTSKTLRWVHSQSAATENLRLSNRRQSHVYESEGFLTLPMISGGRVFDLPRNSQFLHCIDLETGAIQWQVDRQDAVYIAAVHDDSLIVVDRHGCRALQIGSGAQVWSERIGPPGGRGIMLGDRFLLPLLNGKVVSLDVRTGRQLGYPAPIQSNFGAGHLIASRDLIVSTTPVEVSVFRQSHSELHHLLTNQSSDLHPAERQLRIGELQLRTGDLTSAKEALFQSITLAGDSVSHRGPAEELMRELLYIELRSNASNPAATLATLDQLSQKPDDRINYLAHLAEFQMMNQDWIGAKQTVLELSASPTEVPLNLPSEPQLQVMSRAWGAGLLERLETNIFPNIPAQRSAALPVPEQFARESDWPRTIAQFARLSIADPIREEYAKRLVLNEQYQEAESILLINR